MSCFLKLRCFATAEVFCGLHARSEGSPHLKEVHIWRKSTSEGSPHLKEVHIWKKSTYEGSPHLKEVHIWRKSASEGSPHLKEVHIWRKSTFEGSPHLKEVHIWRVLEFVLYVKVVPYTKLNWHREKTLVDPIISVWGGVSARLVL